MFGNNKADDNVGAINLCVHPMFSNKSLSSSNVPLLYVACCF